MYSPLLYKLQLQNLDSFMEKERLDELVSVLSRSIKKYVESINDIKKQLKLFSLPLSKRDEAHEEALQIQLADEDLMIEILLATSFVVFQTTITYVNSMIINTAKLAVTDSRLIHEDFRKKITLISKMNAAVTYNVTEAIADGYLSPENVPLVVVPPSALNVNVIMLIDAAANLFKHEPEWDSNWQKHVNTVTNDSFKRTVYYVSQVGCYQDNRDNYKLLFKAITGSNNYHDLELISKIIINWKDDLVLDFKKELKTSGAI